MPQMSDSYPGQRQRGHGFAVVYGSQLGGWYLQMGAFLQICQVRMTYNCAACMHAYHISPHTYRPPTSSIMFSVECIADLNDCSFGRRPPANVLTYSDSSGTWCLSTSAPGTCMQPEGTSSCQIYYDIVVSDIIIHVG